MSHRKSEIDFDIDLHRNYGSFLFMYYLRGDYLHCVEADLNI